MLNNLIMTLWVKGYLGNWFMRWAVKRQNKELNKLINNINKEVK